MNRGMRHSMAWAVVGAAGAGVVIVMIVAAIFAPWITPYDPEANSILMTSISYDFPTDFLGETFLEIEPGTGASVSR